MLEDGLSFNIKIFQCRKKANSGLFRVNNKPTTSIFAYQRDSPGSPKSELVRAVEYVKRQIIEKKYKSRLEALGMKKVIQVTIGFEGIKVLEEELQG